MNNDKELNEGLDKKLDMIVNPLFTAIYNSVADYTNNKIEIEELDTVVKDLLAIAVLEGVKLAEMADLRLDDKILEAVEKQGERNAILNKGRKEQIAIGNLNMSNKNGKQRRFVSPEDICPITGDLKK